MYGLLLSSTLTIVLCALPCIAQLEWTILNTGTSPTDPMARREGGLGYYQDIVVLFGGQTEVNGADIIMNDLWIYNMDSGTWRELVLSPSPPARYSFVYGVSDHYFYVAMGEGPNKLFYDDVWRLDLRQEEWEELPSQSQPDFLNQQQWNVQSRDQIKPGVRYGAAGGIYTNSSRFYVSQGFADTRYGDTFTYDIINRGWFRESEHESQYSPDNPHGRCLHAGTMISEDELLIYGGCRSGGGTGGDCPSRDSWIFNGKTKKWTELSSCASARMLAALCMLPSKGGERRAVLYGGLETSSQVLTTVEAPSQQIGVFNPDTSTWALRKTTGTVPNKRVGAMMATGKTGAFMFGGLDIDNDRLRNDLYLLKGDASSADQAPKQAQCRPTFFNLIQLHGILMTMGWGLFLQWGAFIARYFRHRDPMWYHLHRLFQLFGLALVIGGFVSGVMSVRFDHFTFSHGIIGIVVTALGLLQPINAIFRPHMENHSERTFKRKLWEFVHLNIGRGTLILSIVNISLGLFLALAHHYIWKIWFAYVCFLVLMYIVMECRNGRSTAKEPKALGKAMKNKYLVKGDDKGGSFSKHGYSNLAVAH